MRLKNKTALITGGASGIGLSIARSYLRSGANVWIADRDEGAAVKVVAELGENARAIHLDVADLDSITSCVTTIEKREPIDILVNNAGIFDLSPIPRITAASFDAVFNVNVRGLTFMLKAVAERMIERKRGGKIINLASQAGQRGEAFVLVYCASKATVISITQSAGLELIRHGINVNAISPGVVDTKMWQKVDALFSEVENRPVGEKKRSVGQAVPFGRIGVPEDLDGVAILLASDEGAYIVGQTIAVNGGNWVAS